MTAATAPRHHWPLLAGIAAMLVATAATGSWAAARNEWSFAYALDDAYIHLATARNAVDHGVWGVTSHAFAPATSSLLWPALLAAIYAVSGLLLAVPLALNLALGAAVLAACDRMAALESPPARLALLLGIVAAGPFPVLLLSGMETMLHILASALFLWMAAGAVADADAPAPRRTAMLAASAFLLVATRFEGLFLVFAACVGLLYRRRWAAAVIVGAAAWLPVAMFAAYSIPRGGMWLPNPVLIKGGSHAPGSLAGFLDMAGLAALRRMLRQPLIGVMAATLLLCGAMATRGSAARWRIGLLLATLLLHMQFARTGHLYRYEAYLLVIAATLLAPFLPPWRAPRRQVAAAAAVLALFAAPVALRVGGGAVRGLYAPTEIYAQQVMMARFVEEHFPGEPIALNDIGAVAFHADPPIADVWGLADVEAARLILGDGLAGSAIGEYLRRRAVRLAIAYPRALGDEHGMIPVATWSIPTTWAVPQRTVGFLAADEAMATRIEAALRDFAPRLPARVEQRFLHPEAAP